MLEPILPLPNLHKAQDEQRLELNWFPVSIATIDYDLQ